MKINGIEISRTIVGALIVGGAEVSEALGYSPELSMALKAVGSPLAISGARWALQTPAKYKISRTHIGGLLVGAAEVLEMIGKPNWATAARAIGLALAGIGLKGAIERGKS